jgi:hypothetical protein
MRREALGGKLAAIPASTATQRRVAVSHACTPNNRLLMNRGAISEQTSLVAVRHKACHMDEPAHGRTVSPGAMRTAISGVRWVTE